MATAKSTLPKGYIKCPWCGAGNRMRKTPDPITCHLCGLGIPAQAAKPARQTRARARKAPAKASGGKTNLVPVGKPIIGVDPGARYTGILVRDGDAVLYSATLVREISMDGVPWARLVVAGIEEVLADFANIPMGIEGISDPKGFQNGRRAAINPKDIIRAGIVLGAVAQQWPEAHIVPPGKNGSRPHSSYPSVLIGRRPKDLPGASNGAGTRNHEQSAYDVAGKAAIVLYSNSGAKLL